MYFHYFVIISHWKGEDLHLYGLESPSPKNALCKVWLKLTQWFWRRRFFFYFVNVFSLFRNYLPLEKGGSFIWTNLNGFPSPMDGLCQVWMNLAHGFCRRWKCEKLTTAKTTTATRRRTTDNFDKKNSLEPSAQVSLILKLMLCIPTNNAYCLSAPCHVNMTWGPRV